MTYDVLYSFEDAKDLTEEQMLDFCKSVDSFRSDMDANEEIIPDYERPKYMEDSFVERDYNFEEQSEFIPEDEFKFAQQEYESEILINGEPIEKDNLFEGEPGPIDEYERD